MSTASILWLPNEILLLIYKHLLALSSTWSDRNSLLLTCRLFYSLFNRELYRTAISSGRWVYRHPGTFQSVPLVVWAIQNDRNEALRYCLDNGVSINATDWCGDSLLVVALKASKVHATRMLLERGASANELDRESRPLLCTALCCGSPLATEFTRILLKHGADANTGYAYGITALHIAALTNWPDENECDVERLLLQHGARVNAVDYCGKTPLWVAVTSPRPRRIGLIRLLLEHGAELNTVPALGSTMLHMNAWSGVDHRDLDAERLILQYGAHANAVDSDGRTPLWVAVNHGAAHRVRFISLLLEYGADPNITDMEGTHVLSILDRAIQSRRIENWYIKDRQITNLQKVRCLLLKYGARLEGENDGAGSAGGSCKGRKHKIGSTLVKQFVPLFRSRGPANVG